MQPQGRAAGKGGSSAFQLALSPLATPVIVTPTGVAAIMVFILLAQQDAGAHQTIALALALVMALNFIVMFFNDPIVRLPGLMPVLQLLGAVLVVVQVALVVQVMIYALAKLGLFVR